MRVAETSRRPHKSSYVEPNLQVVHSLGASLEADAELAAGARGAGGRPCAGANGEAGGKTVYILPSSAPSSSVYSP